MSSFTQKYTLVQFFDDIKEGYEYLSSDWPLHSTVIDTFAIDWPVDKMTVKLTELLDGYGNVYSEAGIDRYFGENGQVQATLLDRTDSLMELHLDVLDILEEGGLVLNDPQFARDGFLPHATVQRSARLDRGVKVRFTALSIVDMYPDEDPYKRKILKTIKIG